MTPGRGGQDGGVRGGGWSTGEEEEAGQAEAESVLALSFKCSSIFQSL